MTKLDSTKVMEQIDMTQRIVERITGLRPATVRVPFGHFTEEMHKWINMPLIQWSVDPQDWKTKDPKVIANRVIANAKPGSVVLLHDIHNATVQALPMILEHLAAKGYTFVTVDELFELDKREVYYKITMDKE